MIGNLIAGEIEQKTNVRFKNIHDFETYNNAIGVDYDSENVISTGWLYSSNAPESKRVNRSRYGRVTNFKQHIVEWKGNNCFTPTSGICLIKCFNHLTGKDYTEEYLPCIRYKRGRSNVMTSARVQQFCGN